MKIESDLSFKVSSMPDLSSEFPKAVNKRRLAVLIVLRDKEEVP